MATSKRRWQPWTSPTYELQPMGVLFRAARSAESAYREAATACTGLSERRSGFGVGRFSACADNSAPDIEHWPSKTAPSWTTRQGLEMFP
jgi:hypothetical protein